MPVLHSPVVVDFPLRGEWWAIATPAERVPSHGTDAFGQRYAFDFVRMDPTGIWYADGGRDAFRHVTVGLAAARFRAWGQPVHSAAGGRVVAAHDGWPDQTTVRLLPALVRASIGPVRGLTPADVRPLTGNYVLVEGTDGVALYAHLQHGSVRVRTGQALASGEVLGCVGNSGNSSMPHLHFHLMDGPDLFTARGLPCAFRQYEQWTGTAWQEVHAGVPPALTRCRAT